jgi:flavin reductase (DIM6/NTAB) family NADH-FMN oxidoreductase RutF
MNPEERKRTLRLFSNGVYILTARSEDRYGGATVTWVSQASFKPPLVMAALRKDSNAFRCLKESGFAAIHVLAADQAGIAQRFFNPTSVENGCMNSEPFSSGATSAPILRNAPAYVECRVRQILEELGDHATVILEVIDAHSAEGVRPLTIAASPWTYGG